MAGVRSAQNHEHMKEKLGSRHEHHETGHRTSALRPRGAQRHGDQSRERGADVKMATAGSRVPNLREQQT